MSTTTKKSFDDQILDGLADWRRLHPNEPLWDIFAVSDWLVDQKGFGLERRFAKREIAKRLAKAQNRKRIRNAQGNRVRVFHAGKLPVVGKGGRIVQKTFCGDRLEISASFAHTSMEQRHRQAEGFCRSMYKDAQDLNDNNPNLKGNALQLELDFRYLDGGSDTERVQIIPTEVVHDSAQLGAKKPR